MRIYFGGNVRMHVKKIKRGNMARRMIEHYERNGEIKAYGNEDIDAGRTHLNYNLHPSAEPSYERYKGILDANYVMDRKDINTLVDVLVTLPEGLRGTPEGVCRGFFERAYGFLAERYAHGGKSIVSAYVHMDESTPHMHFAFVPLVDDPKHGQGFKVCAKNVVDRRDLQTLHADMEKHMMPFYGNVGILNGNTKEGNKTKKELAAAEVYEKYLQLESISADINELLRMKEKLTNEVIGMDKSLRDKYEKPLKAQIGRQKESVSNKLEKNRKLVKNAPEKPTGHGGKTKRADLEH